MTTHLDHLATVPLLRELPRSTLEELAASTQERQYDPGETIVEIGQPGRSLFLVLDGRVQVVFPTRTGDFELASLGPGEFFGEMALLNGMPRSATVRAVDAVRTLVLDKDDFRVTITDTPSVALEILEKLSTRMRRADEQISGLSEQVVRDSLTGLRNRLSFRERISEEIERTRRYGQAFSLILLDLDRFATINDTLGHDVGDEILVWVGRILTEHTRGADAAFHVGGQAFAVLCPSTKGEAARSVACRLVEVLNEARPGISQDVHVSASAGYATCPDHGDTISDLYGTANGALEAAKDAGRNEVCGPDPEEA